jgi:cold shock CspA family protein
MQGTITFWNKDRAFGFIRTTTNGKHESYFLHITEIEEGPLVPSVGDAAEFDIAPAIKNGKLSNAAKVKITAAGVK